MVKITHAVNYLFCLLLIMNSGYLHARKEKRHLYWVGPLVSQNKLVAVAPSSDIFCLDSVKGTLLWKASLNDIVGDKVICVAQPVISENKIVLATERMWVVCLNLENGTVVWKLNNLQGRTVCLRGVTETIVILSNSNQHNTVLTALNLNSGNRLWQIPLPGCEEYLTVFNNEKIVTRTLEGKLISIPLDGNPWETSFKSFDTKSLGFSAFLSVHRDKLILCTYKGFIGKLTLRGEIEKRRIESNVLWRPIICDNILITPLRNIGICSWDLSNLKQLWCNKRINVPSPQEGTVRLATNGKMLTYFRNKEVKCLDVISGDIIWTAQMPEEINGENPSMTEESINVTLSSGILSMNADDGTTAWYFEVF